MRSPTIYCGVTRHKRSAPREHVFSYPYYFFAVDIFSLPSAQVGRLFTYNRCGLFSIFDEDYLGEGGERLANKLKDQLAVQGILETPFAVTLITVPRLLGYTFNPVSFYVVESQEGVISGCIAEVNNTFGEKHLYFMKCETTPQLPVTFSFPKEFFVSPFLEVEGNYRLSLIKFGKEFQVSVTLVHDGKEVLTADFKGLAQPLTAATILKTLVKFPFNAIGTMLRIHLQALRLYFKGIVPFVPPSPRSPATVRSMQRPIHKFRTRGIQLIRKHMNSRSASLKE